MQDVDVTVSFASSRQAATRGRNVLNAPVDLVVEGLARLGVLRNDTDYHLIRAAMVLIFLLFGYQKWFEYEAQVLIPYISNGPLISWMYPVFGIQGASWFLGVSEWLFGALMFLGFWRKELGVLGAAGACFSFIATTTIIPAPNASVRGTPDACKARYTATPTMAAVA